MVQWWRDWLGMCLTLLTTLPFGSSLMLLSLYLFPYMLTPTSEVVFTQLDQPAVMFSPLRVQRRLRCSPWSSRRQKVVSRSSREAEFISLSSSLFSDALPMLAVWQQLIPGIGLQCWEDNEACIAIVQKGFSAKLRHPSKVHRISVAGVCETVSGHQDIKLSYINTSEQRGVPGTKALSVQKWSHAVALLSISTQRLPLRFFLRSPPNQKLSLQKHELGA